MILIFCPCFLIQMVNGVSQEMFKTGFLFINRQVWLIAIEIRQPKGAIRAYFKP
jgi:hypothetical protein